MSNDLKKIFKNKRNQLNTSVPKEIIEVLDDKAPVGFKYQDIGSGRLVLKPSADIEKIVGVIKGTRKNDNFKIVSPADVNGINTLQDVAMFVKNTQQAIVLKNVELLIGNDTKSAQKIFVNTKGKEENIIKIDINSPVEKEIILSGYNEKIKVKIIQKKSPIWTEAVFESADDMPLKIILRHDEKLNKFGLKVSLKIEGEFTVSDIVKYMKLYYAFGKQKIHFNGIDLSYAKYGDNEKKEANIEFIKNSIEWWEKIRELEKKMQVQFRLQMPLQRNCINLLKELYIGIVKKYMYKERINLSNFKMQAFKEINENDIKKINMVTITQAESLKELGVERYVYKRIALLDLQIEKAAKLDDKLNYLLTTKKGSEDKVIELTKFYLTENDVQEFSKDELAKVNEVQFFDDIDF